MNTHTHLGAKCSNTHVHFIGTYVHADMDAVKYVSRYVHTYVANTHTHTPKRVNSADFPCQLLGRDWFKETSICDVSTYLMNPLGSMKAVVRYTACLYCPACVYLGSWTLLGTYVRPCPGVLVHARVRAVARINVC